MKNWHFVYQRMIHLLSGVSIIYGVAACVTSESPIVANHRMDASVTAEKSQNESPQLKEFLQNTSRAQAIFVGEVIQIDERVSDPDEKGRVVPFHFVTWKIEQAVRGVEEGGTWTGRFAGGTLANGRSLWVSEVPEFEVGQRALVLANHGDTGSCSLIGCRDGMIVLDSDYAGPEHGLSEDALEELLASIDPSSSNEYARSADPNLPFQFSTHARTRPLQSHSKARHVRGIEAGQDKAEQEALRKNGYNPVLP